MFLIKEPVEMKMMKSAEIFGAVWPDFDQAFLYAFKISVDLRTII